MKELIEKLKNVDFTHDEIRIETDKYILILYTRGRLNSFLYDQKTLKKLYISDKLRNDIKKIFK